MSEKPISPLRQRMLVDMSVRRFSPDVNRRPKLTLVLPHLQMLPW
jgi:hypothetical protein